ncbi:MAG: hypothetical protein K8E24_005195 [Methanobacterium paludis]|nr:hypothetical protein [Methanobacterium paludis]
MLKYLGVTKELDDNESPTSTTFQVTFAEDDKVIEVKFAELTKFMEGYYGIPRPHISVTWKLTYNFDSTVTIRLKFQYSDTGCSNEDIKPEVLNEVLIAEFEIVYQNFFKS